MEHTLLAFSFLPFFFLLFVSKTHFLAYGLGHFQCFTCFEVCHLVVLRIISLSQNLFIYTFFFCIYLLKNAHKKRVQHKTAPLLFACSMCSCKFDWVGLPLGCWKTKVLHVLCFDLFFSFFFKCGFVVESRLILALLWTFVIAF